MNRDDLPACGDSLLHKVVANWTAGWGRGVDSIAKAVHWSQSGESRGGLRKVLVDCRVRLAGILQPHRQRGKDLCLTGAIGEIVFL